MKAGETPRVRPLPRPARTAIGLLIAVSLWILASLVWASWRDGGVHWYVILSDGGFAGLSLVCALALRRRARWAWWIVVLLWGRRALLYLSVSFGTVLQVEFISREDAIRRLSLYGLWLVLIGLVLGSLLRKESRGEFLACAG